MDITLLGAGTLAAGLIVLSYMIVRARDLVYASGALALLGLVNALLIALLGYTLVAAFLVVVYVGAAVMFIIVAVSMLGGGGEEDWNPLPGSLAAPAVAVTLLMILAGVAAYKAYAPPGAVQASIVAEKLVTTYMPALLVIFVALAATIIEAFAIARRRG
ncbi:MAG: NADH-quinone oxidoreductase subunit J [Desulfurococcales archaeon]|nr:NADH-quinone oxidoreductase subunit J [Desulfurococcales archaeon]